MRLFKILETNFENFDTTIRAYLSKTFGNLGIQYTNTNIFSVIFEGIKGVMQNMMFYIEDAMTEQNIFTAVRKKSIYSLAKISGYEPYYGSAATGTLLANNFISNGLPSESTKLYIPNGTTVQNKITGIGYVVYLPTDYYVFDLSKPLVTHEIKIVQGKWNNARYIAKGYSLETITIENTSLFDRDYVEVYVDNVKYSPAACLYDMTEDSLEYVISVGYDNTFNIIFGSGVYGKKIEESQVIDVRYITHDGVTGNVPNNENINFKFVSKCFDGYGNEVDANDYISLKVNNYISGGSNADTIGEVKSMIGYNSRSLVLASEDNFKLFLKRFSFVGQSTIWSEPNSLSLTASCIRNFQPYLRTPEEYLILSSKDLLLTEEEKSMILTSLNNSNKSFAGIELVFNDPVIRNYSINAYIKIPVNYSKETIKTAVRNTISEYFMKLPINTDFIPKSDIIKAVLDNIPQISSFDIDIISQADEQAYKDNFYYKYELRYINNTYKYVPVKYIYDKTERIGLDQYGNIKVDSHLEIPMLHGPFEYHPFKDKNDMSSVRVDAIQFIFI